MSRLSCFMFVQSFQRRVIATITTIHERTINTNRFIVKYARFIVFLIDRFWPAIFWLDHPLWLDQLWIGQTYGWTNQSLPVLYSSTYTIQPSPPAHTDCCPQQLTKDYPLRSGWANCHVISCQHPAHLSLPIRRSAYG